MYLSKNASRALEREAQKARDNRAEIVKALADGQITRRDLFKWGIFTATGALALKNGLSPFASSAYADIPTGTPRTPLFGAQKFTQPLPRLNLQQPVPLTPVNVNGELTAAFPAGLGERAAKRSSYHTEFTQSGGANFVNPRTRVGPLEGRPPGEFFAHQGWEDYFPEVAYQLAIGRIEDDTRFHPNMMAQQRSKVWSFGAGGSRARGVLPPPLIKARYGEPMVARIYNNLPINRANNGGFGRNEPSVHLHNAHNPSASDGASNAHFFPGTFFDYHWTTTLARGDRINTDATDRRASGPDGNGGLIHVPGDFRELQGTMWFHDHRFFFTAENVYKGMAGMINYYSGPDRGHEELIDGVNLRLPSGSLLDWGNTDFDINLFISDFATDPDGQLFFDIFDTDGFLGDLMLVNFAYAPYFEVLPRKYRLRMLNACMARFIQCQLLDGRGRAVPFEFIATDGNLLPQAARGTVLDPQGPAERFDIIVDFSRYRPGDRIKMVNRMYHSNGRGPEGRVTRRQALNEQSDDPAVGAFLEFRVVDSVESVDVPGVTHYASDRDRSLSGLGRPLTEQIPIIAPDRTRHMEWKRGANTSRDTADGECIPDCGEREAFPWGVRVNGQDTHSLNANQIAALIPRPGETEHWTFENGGGGWDHPIHLHFEEGVTISRRGLAMGQVERHSRKDVWRLGEGGSVTIQVTFGEFGGAYVNHCHNTVHEDFAMLMRWDLLTDDGSITDAIIPTPLPSAQGVTFMQPEIRPEALQEARLDQFERATLDPLANRKA